MRKKTVPWLVPVLLTATLDAQWRDLEGEAVPEITASQWFNTNQQEPTVESLRGKVWLLEFFATW